MYLPGPMAILARKRDFHAAATRLARARPTKPAHLPDWLPETVSRLRKKSGFVSGYRFSTVPQVRARPLGANLGRETVAGCPILTSRFSTLGWDSTLPSPPPTFFHHKQRVSPITDIQPAMHDNDERIRESRPVPVFRGGRRIRQSPILGSFFGNL